MLQSVMEAMAAQNTIARPRRGRMTTSTPIPPYRPHPGMSAEVPGSRHVLQQKRGGMGIQQQGRKVKANKMCTGRALRHLSAAAGAPLEGLLMQRWFGAQPLQDVHVQNFERPPGPQESIGGCKEGLPKGLRIDHHGPGGPVSHTTKCQDGAKGIQRVNHNLRNHLATEQSEEGVDGDGPQIDTEEHSLEKHDAIIHGRDVVEAVDIEAAIGAKL